MKSVVLCLCKIPSGGFLQTQYIVWVSLYPDNQYLSGKIIISTDFSKFKNPIFLRLDPWCRNWARLCGWNIRETFRNFGWMTTYIPTLIPILWQLQPGPHNIQWTQKAFYYGYSLNKQNIQILMFFSHSKWKAMRKYPYFTHLLLILL